jgi:hypothetical protein
MMRFHEDMYVSPSVKNIDKVKRKLRTGSGSLKIYVFVLNHESKKLEFFHNSMLKQKVLHKMDMDVVGLTNSQGECMWLTELMVNDAFEDTGEYDVYKYFMQE